MIYVGTVDWCASLQLQKDSVTAPAPGGTWFGAETPQAEILDPPEQAKGWLTAFDADNGSIRWRFAAPRPILAGVTPTAGAVVFTADMDGTVYAFDATSGAVLWQVPTGQSIGGGIVTYSAGGRQLVAVATGRISSLWPTAPAQSRIVVYGLR